MGANEGHLDSWLLNEDTEPADVTLSGREFHSDKLSLPVILYDRPTPPPRGEGLSKPSPEPLLHVTASGIRCFPTIL